MTKRDKLVEILGRALWNAGSLRLAHDPTCPVAPGTKYHEGIIIQQSDNEADCDCWVSDARKALDIHQRRKKR